jgi:hypothetical protein
MRGPSRYRMEPLPGLEAHAETQQWGPAPEACTRTEQCCIPFSDGGQLGPLFDAAAQEQHDQAIAP